LLEEIKAAVTAARATSLPSSALGKAVNYTLALWPKPTLFLREYLAAVLPGLAETPIHRLAQLTPIAWA
jgi:hypothetical protein